MPKLERIAVIFALGDYQSLDSLPAYSDAECMEDALSETGFDIAPSRIFRSDKQSLRNSIEFLDSVDDALSALPEQSVVIIYYSGHGCHHTNFGYLLCCTDLPVLGVSKAKQAGKVVTLDALRLRIEALKYQFKFVIIVLDSCNRGIKQDGVQHILIEQQSEDRLGADARLPTHFCYVYGASLGQASRSPDNGPSYFTKALATAIKPTHPAATLAEAVRAAEKIMQSELKPLNHSQNHALDPPHFDMSLLDLPIFSTPNGPPTEELEIPNFPNPSGLSAKVKVTLPEIAGSMTSEELQAFMETIKAEIDNRMAANASAPSIKNR